MIAGIERFIATAMRFVRIEPEAPTIIPATISAGLFSATPVAAADSPVNAFSIEITTGMSAPPIGSTTKLPSTAAQSSMPMNSACECEPLATSAASRIAPAKSSALTTCCGRPSVIGRPGSSSCSLPKAMFEPQKETEPTIAANRVKTATYSGRPTKPSELRNSAQAIRKTAPPPTPLKERDHLRHRRHPHAARGRHADGRADHDADRDQNPITLALVQQRRDDRDRHADGGDPVAADRGPRARQTRQAVDEEAERDDVEDVEEVRVVDEGR